MYTYAYYAYTIYELQLHMYAYCVVVYKDTVLRWQDTRNSKAAVHVQKITIAAQEIKLYAFTIYFPYLSV